ncbi:cyclohexanone monooxygenase [Kingella kingae]|uniref:Uncharacterized protein n=3 Tax=Kingella TaxID=32257 RepID=A0A238HHL6_9NEIS|nr:MULTISPECIES: hypothetical protein [Kingella]EGK12354.1 cyclohexanone monooxygenase [Kingella kingae ATCC 23330]MBD3614231.1 cyclohexanone monooxygenase [Kingella kingae]MBD3632823.1 cyclohexanone monooxygenase [Kingella kingae]MBD3658877.1 cyclohexanone monooxygenase [Kingella kingae]MDK4529704.1 cyclohexanone monooxygenase [Kingella kingae]
MMTDPNWIIQKMNEWEEKLAVARDESDYKLEQRATREIKAYRQWLARLNTAKGKP